MGTEEPSAPEAGCALSTTLPRELPHSLEAEEHLLSCIFIDGADTLNRAAAAGIASVSFYDPKHVVIFDCCSSLLKKGLPVELSVVAEELKARSQLDAVGGYPFLAQVSSRIPTTAQANYFIEQVRSLAMRRSAIRASEAMAEDARDLSADIAATLATAEDRFRRLGKVGGRRFPEIETEPEERDVLASPFPIVAGLLEPGDKMSLSSGSKSFKTWSLIQLAYAINTGTSWLGFETTKTRVLFLNFEIKPINFWKRVFRVRRALGLDKSADFAVWNLRGRGFSMDNDAEELIKRALKIQAGVIVLDPIYKLFGDRNESSAGDMATLMALIDRVATETGAAMVYAHHFAKGNASAKDSIDRSSGSGVFSRDPDCLVSMTRLSEQEADNSFAVDVTLREFAPVDRFAVRREHPLMVRDDSLNPANLHDPGAKARKYDPAQLAAIIPAEGIRVSAWKSRAKEKLGMAGSTFYDYAPQAKALAQMKGGLWFQKAS